MKWFSRAILRTYLLIFPSISFATPYYGGTLSYVLFGKEPMHIHGVQFLLEYDPERFQWHNFNLYFDGGVSHLWTDQSCQYSTLNIYSIAPVVRFNFNQLGFISPFLNLSLGLSYLDDTRIEHRNLGIHFAFQDRLGTGVYLDQLKRFTLGLHIVHYSNARLSEHNSGITMPVVLDVGYRFQ